MSIAHLLTSHDDGRATLTIFNNGEVYNLTSNHPNFAEIKRISGDADASFEDVANLIDLESEVQNRIETESLSERVRIDGSGVYIDGTRLKGDEIGKRIVTLMKAGRSEDVTSLVKFIEKASVNPGGIKSINSLWKWLDERNVTFQEDGSFIAYKGVNNGDKPDVYHSQFQGTATVNGVTHKNMSIPQRVGDVVTMPRKEVNDDPENGCSHGLHAGSWQYASRFGRTVLAVTINPADVVSVPNDSAFQKLRVCKYQVSAVVSSRLEEDEKDFFLLDEDDWT